MDNNELTHYGVLGMKWGVRRADRQAARLQSRVDKLKAKKREQDKLLRAKNKVNKLMSEESELKRKLKGKSDADTVEQKPKHNKTKQPKKLSEISDDALRERINRLEMEKRYIDLMDSKNARAQKDIKKGKGAFKKWAGESAKTILVDSAVDIGKQVAKHYMAEAINKKIGKAAVYSNNKKKS